MTTKDIKITDPAEYHANLALFVDEDKDALSRLKALLDDNHQAINEQIKLEFDRVCESHDKLYALIQPKKLDDRVKNINPVLLPPVPDIDVWELYRQQLREGTLQQKGSMKILFLS